MKKFGAIILVLALALAVFPMTALAAEFNCAFGAGDNTATENGITATGSVSASPIEEGNPVTVTVAFIGTATNSGTYTVTLSSASNGVTGLPKTEVTANVVAAGAKPADFSFPTFTMPDAAVDDLVLGMTFTESDAKLSVANIVFDTEDEGYRRPVAKNIVITNSGGTDATNTVVTLTDYDARYFTLSGTDATVSGDSTLNTYTVRPDAGLPAGLYSATINVKYDGGASGTNDTATATVSFRVYDYYYYGGGGLTNTITLTPSSNPYNGYGDLTLSSSGFYNHFQSLSLNGTRLTQGTDYTVENISGAARFTVFASTLQSLGSTTARFTAAFSSGSASTTVTIGTYIPDPVINPPKTGDASSLMGIGLIFMACALAVTVRKVRVRAK